MVDDESFALFLGELRRFVAKRLVPPEAEVEDEDVVPPDIIEEMIALGLFGMSIPSEFGGLGLDIVQQTRVGLLFGETAPAYRMAFMTNVGLGSSGLLSVGTSEQKQRYLPGLASGRLIACFCLTEPEAGSDAASLRTTARRDGDYFVINGTKRSSRTPPARVCSSSWRARRVHGAWTESRPFWLKRVCQD